MRTNYFFVRKKNILFLLEVNRWANKRNAFSFKFFFPIDTSNVKQEVKSRKNLKRGFKLVLMGETKTKSLTKRISVWF
jgi:hypothetical protein